MELFALYTVFLVLMKYAATWVPISEPCSCLPAPVCPPPVICPPRICPPCLPAVIPVVYIFLIEISKIVLKVF